jgi:outer membrane protein assembly factor BamB
MLRIWSFVIIFLLASCSDKEKEYDKTKAVSAFAAIDPIKLDPALENVVITLPKQQANSSWGVVGGVSGSSQNQQIENFSKNFALTKSFFSFAKPSVTLDQSSAFWSFYSGEFDDHFVFAPIIKENKLFFLNTGGVLVAYDLKANEKIWKTRIFKKLYLKNYQTPKIGYGDGKIFAIAGINKIAVVNEVDGQVIWRKDISSIPVSSPVYDENLVYVSTNDNKLYVFDAQTGEMQWVHSGILRPTAIFGAADPVIYKDIIVVSYSSGEIYALNKKTGEALWSQEFNLSRATNSDFYLNDIDATPIAKDDVVYGIGNGGLMMAIDVKTGDYLWKKEIAGIVDFWLAGDFLYLINNDNKLLAISKKTGGIKWISQLPNLEKEKKPQSKILYNGVIMIGDRLVISSLRGELLIASPLDGKIEKTFEVKKKISHAPIVVDGKIYLHRIGKYTIDVIAIE